LSLYSIPRQVCYIRIYMYLILLEAIESSAYILPLIVWVYLHSNFSDGQLFYLCQSGILAVQGHPRSLILVPIEIAYATSYLSVIVTSVVTCTVSEILQVFVLMAPSLFHPNLGRVPVAPGRPCSGQPEHKP